VFTKTSEKNVLDVARRYIREYFAIENTAACTGTLELISEPEPEPTGLTEVQVEKRRVLKSILESTIGARTEQTVLMTLGYTTPEIAAARTAGRWTYMMSLNWHSSSRMNYPTDLKNAIREHILAVDRTFFVTESTITPGTTIEVY
jgi:hypothetical protein